MSSFTETSSSSSSSSSPSALSTPLSLVARVQLGKPLLLPRQASRPLTFSALLSSELFGPLSSPLLAQCDLVADLRKRKPEKEGKDKEEASQDCTTKDEDSEEEVHRFQRIASKEGKVFFQLSPPIPEGAYSLHVFPTRVPPGCFVVPLVIKEFDICAEPPVTQDIICTTFRPFPALDKIKQHGGTAEGLLIKEERGMTMGSHVWDSAVVVQHHLAAILSILIPEWNQSLFAHRPLLCVELGAGVGLIGLQLSRLCHSEVYLTDLQRQVPHTQENILLNNCADVFAAELDWLKSSSINAFSSKYIGRRDIDLIIAADVLYSQELALGFFDSIRQLATPKHTSVLLAQKVRGDRHSIFNVSEVSGFSVTEVFCDCEVIVFKVISLAKEETNHV